MYLHMKQSNALIKQVLTLAREMIIIADEGQAVAEDDGCRLLYAVIQDSAYKIRMEAEREKEAHRKAGTWDNEHTGDAGDTVFKF